MANLLGAEETLLELEGVMMTAAVPTVHTPTSSRIVFSHRGLNRIAPENTIPAFGLAADAGVQWLETDVDILKDGTPVIIHDSTLDRTTNRSGKLFDLTSSELGSVDAGAWFSPEFRGTKLPTFADTIDFLNDRKMNCNVELKAHESGAEGTKKLVDSVLKELERLDSDREIIISSFSALMLDYFHRQAPEFAIGMLWSQRTITPDWLSVLEMTGASYAHLDDAGLQEEWVRAMTGAGYGVNVWTVNTKDRANQLFNWGCTGIFTDVADQFEI